MNKDELNKKIEEATAAVDKQLSAAKDIGHRLDILEAKQLAKKMLQEQNEKEELLRSLRAVNTPCTENKCVFNNCLTLDYLFMRLLGLVFLGVAGWMAIEGGQSILHAVLPIGISSLEVVIGISFSLVGISLIAVFGMYGYMFLTARP